jgi:hypothetical protein
VDKLKILIVEAINESAYGFNLSNEVENAAAIKVVTDEDDFTVVGWSISKIIPLSGIFTSVAKAQIFETPIL